MINSEIDISTATRQELNDAVVEIEEEYKGIQQTLAERWDEIQSLVRDSNAKMEGLARRRQEIEDEISKRDGKK